MKVLVIFAHPVETSLHAALHKIVVDGLVQAGHEVDDCDLYAEGFDPRMTRQERLNYQDVAINREPVADYVERLLRAEALVLCYPVWNYGYPAILKGFFDRVFLPGVSFEMKGDVATPSLHNIQKVMVVTSYGGSRLRAMMVGDPPRRLVTRVLRFLIKPLSSVTYLALYSTNLASPAQREAFKARVAAKIKAF